MLFSSLIDSISDIGTVEVPEEWRQGRTTYGGLSAALCVAGALNLVGGPPPLRAAQFVFLGPASGVLRIVPSVLRQGKNTVFVAVDLLGEAGLATRATLVFGAPRESVLRYQARPMPAVPTAAACREFFPDTRRPRFAWQFETRRAGGAQVASGAAEPDLLAWIRHKDAGARHGLLGLVALADMLPPAAFTMLTAPGQISTVTWSLDMMAPETAAAGSDEGWHLMQSRGDHVADGYTSQDMVLWNEAGVPLLVARQTVAVFA